jgi:hypothetical protein
MKNNARNKCHSMCSSIKIQDDINDGCHYVCSTINWTNTILVFMLALLIYFYFV